ncbi:AAA family ATPase [Myxococcota bacterium]|nr:AAA family ATPase [Myxococcota bacterium]
MSMDLHRHETDEDITDIVEDIPRLTPREIFDELGQLGYVGQDNARRTMSLMAYRHVQRVRAIHLDAVPVQQLPPKSNHLLIGPTGCGKTHLIELLFRHIFKLPTALVDITNYSETGYVGQDVNSILTRLIYAAENSVALAEIGVICLDEFDKIASGQNNAVFSGAGTTKDISGLGVQRELLKLLESTQITVPTEFSHSSYQQFVMMSTANIPFIACGAFSGFKLITHLFSRTPRLGFTTHTQGREPQEIAVSYTEDEVEQTRHFQQYGFLPELIARFDRIIPFRALDRDTLLTILQNNLISTLRKEFSLAGIHLDIDPSLDSYIVDQALRRETGARGLRSTLSRMLEDVAFDVYSEPSIREVRVAWKQDALSIDKS